MKPIKLNLGCGEDYKEGYVNCDWTKDVKVDKIVDLEKKLPFKDNSVEEILCVHVLEHITNFVQLMNEFHRVCKKGAKIYIKTPFYTGWYQYIDPTHVRFFTPWTFKYFEGKDFGHEVDCSKAKFKVLKVKINWGMMKTKYLNFLFNPLINLSHKIYCRFFAWIFPSEEIVFELETLK